MSRPGQVEPAPEVLLLAADPRFLPRQDVVALLAPWWRVTVATAGDPAGVGYAVSAFSAPPSAPGARLGRAGLARAKGAVQAWRAGAPRQLVWALKSNPRLRAALRGSALIVSLDPPADRALSCVPGLVGDTAVVRSTGAPSMVSSLLALSSVLHEVLSAPRITADLLSAWQDRLRAVDPPVGAGAAAAAAHVVRGARSEHGPTPGAQVAVLLDQPPWPRDERLEAGLAAQRLSADLTLGAVTPDTLPEHVLTSVTTATLEAADAALLRGAPDRALALLADAMAVLFHRNRHAEVTSSPLVDEPGRYLSALYASSTWRALTERDEWSPGSATPAPVPTYDHTPRVLVVTGAYGSFHRGVAAAVQDGATVRIRDFARAMPLLRRKHMDPGVLPALAAWIGDQRRGRHLGQDLAGLHLGPDELEQLRGVGRMTRWAQVIFSDWADRSTVWISHACPPGTRLVIRIHALDALDPWIHLVRWDRVEQVVVVSEPWRSLVADILAALGVEVPIRVLDNLVDIRAVDRPKRAAARRTLGMVGWGRMVKDPLWALDLLDRDPSWRLVLIGAGFPDPPSPSTRSYVEEVHARMTSPTLRERITVVGHTDDVGEALRDVGVILSTSRRETWHLGLVEGAASGAVPVVRDWPLLRSRGGARAIFDDEWVVDDLDQAEARIRATTAPAVWAEEGARAKRRSGELFDPERVAAAYRQLLIGPSPPR